MSDTGPSIRSRSGALALGRRGRRGERGSATVLVAIWVAALAFLAGAGIVLTTVMASRVAVATAADLAALAGATASLTGPAAACEQAASTGRRNAVVVEQCAVSGGDVRVTVAAPAPTSVGWLIPGWDGILRARAHASVQPESL